MTQGSAPSPWIADIASEEAQQRYIVNATSEEYLLAEEMLDIAGQHAERELEANASSLSREQTESLQELVLAINHSDDFLAKYDRSNIADLINIDEHWALIRAAAKRVVTAYERASKD